MLANYVRVATRNLARKRLYTAISIIVLAVGLAMSLVVIGMISYETSFDKFHADREHIYRVEASISSPGEDPYVAACVLPSLGRALEEELPQAEQVAVFRPELLSIVKIDQVKQRVIDEHASGGYAHHPTVMFATPAFLHVFNFAVKEGNRDSILSTPSSLLITESAARRYFPNQNPVGRTIEINERYNCTVAGVLYDMPQNTQLFCDMMVSYRTLESPSLQANTSEPQSLDYVYVRLRDEADVSTTAATINRIASKYLDPASKQTQRFNLRPLDDVYFIGFNVSRGELNPQGELSFLIEVSMTALFILLLAIANYVNLATARASERMREIGVRKVFGANRGNIVTQSLGESLVLTSISCAIGLILYELFKLGFEGAFPRPMLANVPGSPLMIAGVFALVIIVSVIAGFYPGLYLSRYRPLDVLTSKRGKQSTRSLVRKGLVVFQFAIASMFVFVVVVMYRQSAYQASFTTGFNASDIVMFDFFGNKAVDECQRLRNELDGKAFVVGTASCDVPPGRGSRRWNLFFKTEARLDNERIGVPRIAADYDLLELFGIKVTKGRWFSRDVASDLSNGIVVNTEMANTLWAGDAIGRRLYTRNSYVEVIGVVDYSGPMNMFAHNNRTVFKLAPDEGTSLAVKIAPGQSSTAIAAISSIWKRVLPETEFMYAFLDDEIAGDKRDSETDQRIFLWLALTAIAIACLGIFGLVSYSAGQRVKEIGVRKVLGAPMSSVVSLLSREFVWLILLAGVIGCSLGYLLAQDVLRGYAMRVPIGLGTPLLTIALSLLAGMVVAGLKAWQAGRANPVESLKYE